MKLLITGGCGFIGSNYLNEYAYDFDKVINVDKITYAAKETNVNADVRKMKGYSLVKKDICDPSIQNLIKDVDVVLHMAAESHVDNSIKDSSVFVKTNVLGTHNILEGIRLHKKRLIYVSTDEVYGPVSRPVGIEVPVNPQNPYAATKAAAEMLCRSYQNTYGCEIKITRCCNNMGPNQHEEKAIPRLIKCIKERKDFPLYGRGEQEREWIYVTDHTRILHSLVKSFQLCNYTVLNIGTGYLVRNIELFSHIGNLMKKGLRMSFVPDRLGHDIKYHIDPSFTNRVYGSPRVSFEEMIDKTIEAYL